MLRMQVLGLSTPCSHAGKALPSRLHVLHGSRVMDCLFESSPDYAGVTGLFPIAMTPHEGATTAAVIISFASGSRALTAGGDARAPDLCTRAFFVAHACILAIPGLPLVVVHALLDIMCSSGLTAAPYSLSALSPCW